MTKIVKPILKWVGGKTQILDKILDGFPKTMNNYHEIFLGGGSVLLGFLSLVKEGKLQLQGRVFAYDLNEPLIYLYKNIQTSPEELYKKLQEFVKDYHECKDEFVNRTPTTLEEAKKSQEAYYYWMRSRYNQLSLEEKKSVTGSALFLFLNKTCFRGLFRMGPNGFNVPYGNYKNPAILNKEHLFEIHELIQDVTFECADFSESLKRVKENDMVYLDPPYAPESKTSFVKYNETGFSMKHHEELFDMIHDLHKENKNFMMSNADVPIIHEEFPSEKYKMESILCKRSIHSKKPDTKTREVLIKNY